MFTLFDQDFTAERQAEIVAKQNKTKDIITVSTETIIIPEAEIILKTETEKHTEIESQNLVEELILAEIVLEPNEIEEEENEINDTTITNEEIITNLPTDQPPTEELAKNKTPTKKKTKTTTDEAEPKPTIPEDWKGEKQYYTIGEVADLFKVKTSHIRFWTNEFELNVRTTRKGDRLYTTQQIQELKTIHYLVKEKGFTLTGAKAKLKEKNKRVMQTIDLKESLIQLRSKLVGIRKQLK